MHSSPAVPAGLLETPASFASATELDSCHTYCSITQLLLNFESYLKLLLRYDHYLHHHGLSCLSSLACFVSVIDCHGLETHILPTNASLHSSDLCCSDHLGTHLVNEPRPAAACCLWLPEYPAAMWDEQMAYNDAGWSQWDVPTAGLRQGAGCPTSLQQLQKFAPSNGLINCCLKFNSFWCLDVRHTAPRQLSMYCTQADVTLALLNCLVLPAHSATAAAW
jgi:hypothetical protein